jgi:hypothetical protein
MKIENIILQAYFVTLRFNSSASQKIQIFKQNFGNKEKKKQK